MCEIRTDNGHDFQAKFHGHVEYLGIRDAYIKRYNGRAVFNGIQFIDCRLDLAGRNDFLGAPDHVLDPANLMLRPLG